MQNEQNEMCKRNGGNRNGSSVSVSQESGDCRVLRRALGVLHLAFLVLLAGCGGCTPAPAKRDEPDVAAQYSEEMRTHAMERLDRFDEAGEADLPEQMIGRINQKSSPGVPFDPLLTCWPEPDMLRHIVDRLNQWIRVESPEAGWDPIR